MSSEKSLNKNAQAFFNRSQLQTLNRFFEEHGDTVYNIFKNTTTTTGVMVLFIVVNGLTKNFKDFLLNFEHEPRNTILLPISFDKVSLEQYQKLRTKREYILKCKECDFISYITYTMEHMAFVHNIHHGFGLTMNIFNKYSLNEIPTIKHCIFQTPISDNCHLFRDHFTNTTNLRDKKLDVHFNNRKNLISKCFLAYLRFLEQNGKLYTIDRCEHENQISIIKCLKICACIKKTMIFYKRFHTKLFELLKMVGLTHLRTDRFESCDPIKLQQRTKKIIIFKRFAKRIVTVFPDFFTTVNDDRVINQCPTVVETNEESDNSIEIITENIDPVIVIDSSNSSHGDKTQVPSKTATQTSGFGIPFMEETQNCFDDSSKGSADTVIFPYLYGLCEVTYDTKANLSKIEEVQSESQPKTSTLSSENNESYDTKANISKIEEILSESQPKTSTLCNICAKADKIGNTKQMSQSKLKIRSSLLKKIKNVKKSQAKRNRRSSLLKKIKNLRKSKSNATRILTKKTKKTLDSNKISKSPTKNPSKFETLIKEILTTIDKNDEIHQTATPEKDTNNPDEAADQSRTIESFLNKHFNLNECNSNFFEFPVEHIESVVEDSSKISNRVRIFEEHLFGDSLKCDPIEEYKEYQKYNRFLSMLESKHTKNIEHNDFNEETALSFLKCLDFGDDLMDVVKPQTKSDYEDILNQYSTAHKLNYLFLDELNNPNVGSAIFRDILNESIDYMAMQTESSGVKPFIMNVPANFKANCNITCNKSILSSMNKIIEKKTEIDTKELNNLLSLLKTFVEKNKDVE